MKKYKIVITFIWISLLFSGCSKVALKKSNPPILSNGNKMIELLEPLEYYLPYKKDVVELSEEKRHIKFISGYQYPQMYWVNTRWNAYCDVFTYNKSFIKRPCLVDMNNTGSFTHIGFWGFDNLFKLKKPLSYEIIQSAPTHYYDSKLLTGLSLYIKPKLKETTTKEIGETIYTRIPVIYKQTKQVILKEPILGYTKDIYGQDKREFKFVTQKPIQLLSWEDNSFQTISLYNDGLLSDEEKVYVLDIDNDGDFDVSTRGGYNKHYPLYKKSKYILEQGYDIIPNELKVDVLYQGRIGNKIKISFREFLNGMARPAFTQDIEYELDKQGKATIGFKGLRIEVIKATNVKITYRVTKDYKHI